MPSASACSKTCVSAFTSPGAANDSGMPQLLEITLATWLSTA